MQSLSSPLIALILAVALLLAAIPDANASRGRYDKLYILPTPGPITIDGDLSDWDRSAQIEFFVVPETRASQSAFFTAMYDDEALYLGGVIRDNSPMMNRHDPEASGNKGWDADSVQFRLVTDAEAGFPLQENAFKYRNLRDKDGNKLSGAEQKAADTRNDIIHLTLWHYTDESRPALQMHQGFTYRVPDPAWAPHGVVPNDKFQAKYKKADDGLSYTFEYRIPWSTLQTDKPLKAGDIVAGTVQVSWSRPDGLKTAGGAAWAYDVLNRPGFPFQSGEVWGKLIFREEGNIARELVDAGLPPEKPLPLGFRYEVPEDSEVTVQLKNSDGLIVRTLVAQGMRNGGVNIEKWDGLDSQGNPLAPGSYEWVGNYHDPIKLDYRFSVHNSGQPPYPTPNNKGGWGGDHGVPTTAAAIPGTDDLLLAWSGAEYGWGTIRVDRTGKKQWGSKHSASHIASDGKRFFTIDQHGFHAADGVKVFDAKDSRPLSFDGQTYAGLEHVEDAGKNFMTGLAYRDGKLYIAYADRNAIGVFDANNAKHLTTIKVNSPGHLAAVPAESPLAASADVLAVSDNTVVKIKGDKATPFIADHLANPQGIAADQAGRVFAANRGELSNVSAFDMQGKFVASIGKDGGRNAIGAYEANGMYQPDGIAIDRQGRLWVAEHADSPKRISVWNTETGKNVDQFFGGSSYFGYCIIDPAKPTEIYAHNTLWKIDWQKLTTTPVSTIWRQAGPNHMLPIKPDGYQGLMRVFTHENGQQFAHGQGNNASILSIRKGDIFQPIMAFFSIRRGQYGYGKEQFELITDKDRYPNGQYFWQDANDDGIVQHEEITNLDGVGPNRFRPQFRDFDRNTLTGWISGGYSLAPNRWTDDGRPLYDPADITPNALHGKPQSNGYTWLDPSDGSIFTLTHGQSPSWAKWSADGKLLAGYPALANWRQSLGYPVLKPGRLWGMTGPLGVAGEFTGNATYFGMSQLFDTNGHYIAGLGYDGRVGGHPSLQGQPEGQGGAIVKLDIPSDDSDAPRYFLLQGGQDGRVMEIENLDTIKPLAGGTYVLAKEDVDRAQAALKAYEEALARSAGLSIVRTRSALDVARTVGAELEGGRGFSAAMAYDSDNLYVKYDVKTDSPLVNDQPDPRLIFKGGNLIDIQLATNPEADPDREDPAPGDIRLLVSRTPAGETKAVLYQPRLKGKHDPIVLKSPTGEEPFDAITEVSDQIGLEYNKTRDGFTAIITIPLDLIDLQLVPTQSVSLDLGYIFGNKQGTQAQIRAYWVNKSFTANVVNDIPHESRLEPNEWEQATVE